METKNDNLVEDAYNFYYKRIVNDEYEWKTIFEGFYKELNNFKSRVEFLEKELATYGYQNNLLRINLLEKNSTIRILELALLIATEQDELKRDMLLQLAKTSIDTLKKFEQ